MNPEKDDHTANRISEITPNVSLESNLSSEPPLTYVWYCKKCRDVSLGSICVKCQKAAVKTQGTFDQYKKVGQALLDNRNDEWRNMLESMIME